MRRCRSRPQRSTRMSREQSLAPFGSQWTRHALLRVGLLIASCFRGKLYRLTVTGTHRVYIGDDGMIYDAALNQTNAGENNNKFYRVQILVSGAGNYKTWTRWGRVGELGKGVELGNGSLEAAMGSFEKKFKDKAGVTWYVNFGLNLSCSVGSWCHAIFREWKALLLPRTVSLHR